MRTVGVEEELLLVDPGSGVPRAVSAAVLARAGREEGRDGSEAAVFEKELHRQQLEFATHPQSDLGDLAAEIRRCRALAARLARESGGEVAALATSPLPVRPSISAHRRYAWMADAYGMAVHEQLVCGCHVHVSVDSDDEGVAVLDRIRPWLAVLTALSANSPFWQGKDTGYASYRTQVWHRWPSAGPTEAFGSAARYHRRVADMIATGALLDEGMVYFDARLSRTYPTVEIRVADVCLHTGTAVLVAALARALVETAARAWRSGGAAPDRSVSLLRLAAWRAARSGLSGELLHPVTLRPAPAESVLRDLVEHVREPLADHGDADRVREALGALLRHGDGARVQRETLERTGSLRDVVAECVRRTQA